MGIASIRRIGRDGAADLEVWRYPTDEGYASLRFVNGRLLSQEVKPTRLTFARDTSLHLSKADIQNHLVLLPVNIGWHKSQVQSLAITPSNVLDKTSAAEFFAKLLTITTKFSGALLVGGFDAFDPTLDLQGELWVYDAPRLSTLLIFRDNMVAEIIFMEKPTESQATELLHRAL